MLSKKKSDFERLQAWSVSLLPADTNDMINVELKVDPEYIQRPSQMDSQGFASAMALGCFVHCLERVAQADQYGLCEEIFHESFLAPRK